MAVACGSQEFVCTSCGRKLLGKGLRERTIARVLALPVGERIALAFQLGDDDLALYVRASGLERDEARRRLRARRQIGRTPSRSAALEGR